MASTPGEGYVILEPSVSGSIFVAMIYVDLSMQIAQSIGTCGVLNRHSRWQHAPGTRQLAQCFNNYSFDTRYTRVPPS